MLLQKGHPEFVSTGSAYWSVKLAPKGGVKLVVTWVAEPDAIAPRLSPVARFVKSTINPHCAHWIIASSFSDFLMYRLCSMGRPSEALGLG